MLCDTWKLHEIQILAFIIILMLIHLHINYGYKVMTEKIWPAKSKIFTTWPCKKKCFSPSYRQKYFVLPTGGYLMHKRHKNIETTLNISSNFII